MLQLLQEVSDVKVQYKIVVGDFNLPRIKWSNYTTEAGPTDFNTQFIERIRDCFFTQHIQDITRTRGDKIGSTLDLVFSNEDSIIDDIRVECPLGRSDHACILFNCDIQEVGVQGKRVIYLYEKANYQLMRQRMNVDWTQYLSEELNTEEKWNKMLAKLREIVEECVPKKQYKGQNKIRQRTNENLPMNRKLWSKIKKKQRLWTRLKQLKQEDCPGDTVRGVEEEYRRLNNQVRRQTRNAVKIKEKEISSHVKDNPKIFWQYVTSKTKTKSGIGDLYDSNEKNKYHN